MKTPDIEEVKVTRGSVDSKDILQRAEQLTSTWVSGKTGDKDSWSLVICLTALRMAWDGIGAFTSHCR